MLKSLKIENFRCFQLFELQQLGRVNLLVGTNNSGKTSILEAIQLFCSRTNLETLGKVMINRGEYLWSDERERSRELDIRHLYLIMRAFAWIIFDASVGKLRIRE